VTTRLRLSTMVYILPLRHPLEVAKTVGTVARLSGNRVALAAPRSRLEMVAPDEMTPLFQAAAEATEEAILNALTAAETTTGRSGRTVHAVPLDRLREVMRRYRRID